MSYVTPKYITQMTPRERWKLARHCLQFQWDVRNSLREIACCFYSSNFEVVRYCVDEYGMMYGTLCEKYVFVKRRKGDSYGYRVSRFGVTRVGAWDND